MKKILIVDDEQDIVESLKFVLEVSGFVCYTAFNGEDGLRLAKEIMPDLIILDPPRDGIHPKALPKIIGYGVEHIVYISCKPTSLVRDLETFLDSGYIVEKAVAVDQFPWTANCEVVCLLSKRHKTEAKSIVAGLTARNT